WGSDLRLPHCGTRRRHEDTMTAFQITIPAENKPGTLLRVTSVLSKEKINIRAITITSFGGSGFFHLVVDDPKLAHAALEKAGIANQLKEVIAVLIDDAPGSLDRLIQRLFEKNVNVENAYGFVLESRQKAVFVIDVQKIEEALRMLAAEGYKTLDADALNAVEPFHYMKY
nr:ACT domain-containing protein [Spirochaetota bacterium]